MPHTALTLKTLGLALAAGLLATSSSFAQDTTGAIEGDVTDKTASAVVGARIVATNLETGFSKETTANADGFYRLLQLPVGRYSVTITDPRVRDAGTPANPGEREPDVAGQRETRAAFARRNA